MKTSVWSLARSSSAERSALPFMPIRRVSPDARTTSTSTGTLGPRSRQLHPARRLTEADELRIVPRARREPLSADVKRLEQVRLPGAVRAGHENDPRLEGELELRIGAEVSERGVSDDQPSVGRRQSASTQSGSRIGMIRYQKLSSGDDSNPGRSGLMSWSCTVSPLTASRPSRRKSGLNPISSGSPA